MKKTILICMSSSIAAYKVLSLIKHLKREYTINVIATKNTLNLIPVREFEKEISIYTELFHAGKQYTDYFNDIDHLKLAKADLLVLVPATANVIGKIANGIADDLLTTTVMASSCPKIIAPAMHSEMYKNPIVQENIATLKKYGYTVIGPDTGHLACGDVGIGRLVDMDRLYHQIKLFFSGKFLSGKKVLITAGSTREYIDPVRYISNGSSGKMGTALAEAACHLGAEVILVTGPISREVAGVKTIPVESGEEMHQAVIKLAQQMDIIVMAAAVADFKPVYSENKIKRNKALTLTLQPTPDILAELGKNKRKNQVLVGFALETNNVLEPARKKFREKNVDMLIVNTEKSIGADTSEVVILTHGEEKKLPMMAKIAVAQRIFEVIERLL